MKRMIIGLLFFGCGITGHAQTFGKMVQTMLQQIATLEGYLVTAEKGYKIAEDGLHTIRDIKNGEFNLHTIFFQSLASVNSKVADMAEVAESIHLQAAMVKQFSARLNNYRKSAWLHPDELSYIEKVYSAMVNAGLEEMNALTDLVTDGQLKMTDGGRIRGIQSIHAEVKQQYRFVQSFTNRTDLLAVQRQQERKDIGSVMGMYGID